MRLARSANGVIAIEHYVIERPDLVLLDLTMHNMQGMDVLIKLREIDGQARIVIATADVQRTTRAMVAYHGAAGFISKTIYRTRCSERCKHSSVGRN
ncbi:MAG: hypothetical protein KatS3mg057_0145 [Herpetosiphonaceae bacterium]|nr:MAG: hypothetical protein KatS3mg057_0145 [Herpetosiphonaceae bacterium]